MGLKSLFIRHLFPGCCTSLPFSSLMTGEVVGVEAGRLLRVQSTRDSGTPWIRGCLHNLDIPGQSPSVLPREATLLGSSFLLAKTSYPFSILLATSMLLPRAPPARLPHRSFSWGIWQFVQGPSLCLVSCPPASKPLWISVWHAGPRFSWPPHPQSSSSLLLGCPLGPSPCQH